MTAPTVLVSFYLADFGGPAVPNVLVKAKMSAIDFMADGTLVTNKEVAVRSQAGGLVQVPCFPNALAPDGLGTRATTIAFSANLPGSKALKEVAVVPNRDCSLVDILVDVDPAPPPPDYVTRTNAASMTNKELVNPAARTVVLADGPTITWDADDGQTAFLTLSTTQASRAMANLSHIKPGVIYALEVTQHPLGNQNIDTWGSAFTPVGDVTINPTASSVTVLLMLSNGVNLRIFKTGAFAGAPSPAPAPAAGPIPFASRVDGAYPYGIKPSASVFSDAAAEANIKAQYIAMYDAHFVSSMSALAGGMGPCMNPSASAANQHIVSEGIGYWMLIAVVMHGVDMGSVGSVPRKTPKEQFDGCLRTALAHPALGWLVTYPGDSRASQLADLMAYMIKADGSSMPIDYQYNAVDGDLDIALACLMAHRQWGSAGTYNYAQLATNRINAIKAWVVTSEGTPNGMAQPAGAKGYPADPAFMMARTSDFMYNHFRNFARHTQDPFWMGQIPAAQGKGSVYERCLWLSEFITTLSSPVLSPSGLLPDFIEGVGEPPQSPSYALPFLPLNKLGHGDPGLIAMMVDHPPYTNYTRWPSPADLARGLVPGSDGMIQFDPAISATPQYEGSEDEYYTRARNWDSNACRDQWRYVTEYVLTGNPRVKAVLDKFNTFFKGIMTAGGGNDATLIQDSYNLDGTVSQFASTGELSEVLGSAMAGMCSDATYQAQLDKLWRWNTGLDTGRNDAGYYAGEIQLMSKLVAAGLWWEPKPGVALPASGPAPSPSPPPPPPPPAPAPGGAALIQARFTAGGLGFWGKADAVSQFWNSSSDHTHPANFTTDAAAAVWINKAGSGAGGDAIESNPLQYPILQNDGTHNFINVTTGMPIANVGGSSTAFHNLLMLDDTSYGPDYLYSDYDAATHTGSRLSYDGNGPDIYKLEVGIGTTTVVLQLSAAWADSSYRPPGKHLVETWYEGTNIGIRIDKDATKTATMALGAPMAAGNTTMMFDSDRPEDTAYTGGKYYEVVFFKNYCASLADRNAMATYVASSGGLTV